MSVPLEQFSLSDFDLHSGMQIPELKLAYRCYGSLNSKADNAILFPTYYTGTDRDNARLLGPGRALDTDQYFILVPNMFGNGVSSSPSNMPAPYKGSKFPQISLYDNVRAQHILAKALGIDQLKLVLGWSMGAMQTYQWCAQYPQAVEKALIICGSAKTAEHNQVFLEGVKAALMADSSFAAGDYSSPPQQGLKAFARVYAGWAYSQSFFRHRRYRDLGFDNPEALLKDWETDHLQWDANDLLAMLATWQNADISDQPNYQKNLPLALKSIQAQVWLMPCEQDLYFRHEDNRNELSHLQQGQYCGFESDFGHCAAGPGRFTRETELIENRIRDILSA